VYYDCGQGIENGYDGPTNRMNHCLFTACQVGARHGDNYDNIGNYNGRETVTNSIFLYNHHDVFGYNWHNGTGNGWTQAVGQMSIDNNLLTTFDTNFPNNAVWNPPSDGWRLAAFQTAPIGHVGLALATRPGQTALTDFPNGVPVALSSFCTNEVTVDYAIEATDGTRTTGLLRFVPGRVRQFIPPPPAFTGVLRVALRNPQHADLTGAGELVFQSLASAPATNVSLIAAGSVWRYLDTGVNWSNAWLALDFNDSAWPSGCAQLGFGEGDQCTSIASNRQITTYFRRAFTATNPSLFSVVRIWLLRDDGGVVYLNGTEVFRSPNVPAGPIAYNTLTVAPNGENTIDNATYSAGVLRTGTNVAAVEIHQATLDSSDVSFDFSLSGDITPAPRLHWGELGADLALYWNDPSYVLWEAPSVTGPWSVAATRSPLVVPPAGTRFYQLRK
jgi:hypothetical protein